MPHNISHFSVHADDVNRARAFYQKVFAWKFEPWGPPDFFLITTGTAAEPGIHGSLQRRTDAAAGKGLLGFECTISVQDLDAITAAIQEHGGRITYPKMHIPGVGSLIQFADTEGNILCAMRYDDAYQPPPGALR